MSADRLQVDDLMSATREEILATIKDFSGLRVSPRLTACVEIVYVFGVAARFGRLAVCSELSEVFSDRCLDRALFTLEGCGAIQRVDDSGPDVDGNAEYVVADPAMWGPFNADRVRLPR